MRFLKSQAAEPPSALWYLDNAAPLGADYIEKLRATFADITAVLREAEDRMSIHSCVDRDYELDIDTLSKIKRLLEILDKE